MKKPVPTKSNSTSKSHSSTRRTNPAKKSSAKKAVAKKAGSRKKTSPAHKARVAKPAPRKTPRRKPAAPNPSRKALVMIGRLLDEDQAENVAVIDLAGKSAMADFMVIASGRNPRHIGAMAQHLREKIKALSGTSPPIEGLATADWVLVDQGDVVVHLFRPEIRRLYNLEKMWGATLGPERDDTDPPQPG